MLSRLHVMSVFSTAVGIALRCRVGGPGIESRCGAMFSAHVQTGSGAHPGSCAVDTLSLSPGGVCSGWGVTKNHPPHLAPELKKKYRLNLLPF